MEITDQTNWSKVNVYPKIEWASEGDNIFDKIKSSNYDPSEFKVDLENSILKRYDYITDTKRKVIVKNLPKTNYKDYKTFSEPVLKVSAKDTEKLQATFNTYVDHILKRRYNNFLRKLIEEQEDIQMACIQIISSFDGVQFKDGYVKRKDLEFNFVIEEKENGFNCFKIVFKIK